MRPLSLTLYLCFLALPAEAAPLVPAIPATVPVSAALETRPLEPEAQIPSSTQEPPAKAIGIGPAPGVSKAVKNKKPSPPTRDELVERLQSRIKALEAQQDKEIVNGQIKDSLQRPVNSASIESKTIYDYVPDAIYLIYAAVNHVVDVQLQPGEKMPGSPVAGDTVRWVVGTTVSGAGADAVTHVLIKPIHANIETNFLIATDRHSYRLYARSSDNFFIPTVGWNYPAESMAELAGGRREQQRLDDQVAGPALAAADLNFNYKIKADGDYSWTPVRAFDDGNKTYIQMSPAMKHGEAPAFFIREGKELNLVNYRVRGGYFVVDRLFEEGELRCGKKDVVRVVREKPSRSWFFFGSSKKESGPKSRAAAP